MIWYIILGMLLFWVIVSIATRNKGKRFCESCFNEYPRQDLKPVSTHKRGILIMCKSCAAEDRERAKKEIENTSKKTNI